jgi:S-adenosylmethionine synthetase
MSRRYIFSSESVGEEFIPTKFAIPFRMPFWTPALPKTRTVAWRAVYAKSNVVVVGGEITTSASPDYTTLVRDCIRGIGYTNDDDVFHADKVFVMNIITAQSPDIARCAATHGPLTARIRRNKAPERRYQVRFACYT